LALVWMMKKVIQEISMECLLFEVRFLYYVMVS